MTFFRGWLLGIVAASMALSLVYALLPKGAILMAAKCTGSLIIILVMLRPVLALRAEDFLHSYEQWEREIAVQAEDKTAENVVQMETLIRQETAAYISEKAAQWGLAVEVEVFCELREGVPFPAEVHLDIPYHGELSAYIAEELDIAAQRQYWRETEDAG